MSTKIYYGKKVKAKTLADVKDVVEKIKKKHNDYVLNFFEGGKPTSAENFSKVIWDTVKEFDLDVGIGYDRETESFYLVLMGAHGICANLDSVEELEEFSYWDNTDPPDDVSEEEFIKRGRVWERLMPTYESVGEQMFCISVKANPLNVLRKYQLTNL